MTPSLDTIYEALKSLLKPPTAHQGGWVSYLRLMVDLSLIFFVFPLTLFFWIGDDFFAYTHEHLLYTTSCLTLCVCAVFHSLFIHYDAWILSYSMMARLGAAVALSLIVYIPFNLLLSLDEDFALSVLPILGCVIFACQILMRALCQGVYTLSQRIKPYFETLWSPPQSLFICESRDELYRTLIENIHIQTSLLENNGQKPRYSVKGCISFDHKHMDRQIAFGVSVCTSMTQACMLWAAQIRASVKHVACVITDPLHPSVTQMIQMTYRHRILLLTPIPTTHENDPVSFQSMTIDDLCPALVKGYQRNDARHYASKVIMLTYAASPHAFDLVMQLLTAQVKKLILFDHDEVGLSDLRHKLTQECSSLLSRCEFIMGHVSDHSFVDYLITTYKPQMLFHMPRWMHHELFDAAKPMACIRSLVLSTEFLSYAAHKHELNQCALLITCPEHKETGYFFLPLIKAAFMRYAANGSTQYLIFESDPPLKDHAALHQKLTRMQDALQSSQEHAYTHHHAIHHDLYWDHPLPLTQRVWANSVLHGIHMLKKSRDLMEYHMAWPSMLKWRDVLVYHLCEEKYPFSEDIWKSVYEESRQIDDGVTYKNTKHPYITAREYTGWLENETLERILNAADQCDDVELHHMLHDHEAFLEDAA